MSFKKILIKTDKNIFKKLSQNIEFEEIVLGRTGAILVNDKLNIPLIRTTTQYKMPAQKFLPIHQDIISEINKQFSYKITFNNALTEIYDSRYIKMGYHSDQSLDLDDNSYIGLFSCYDDPTYIRKLLIKEKSTGICSEILLEHNSVVLFSTTTNRNFLHKII